MYTQETERDHKPQREPPSVRCPRPPPPKSLLPPPPVRSFDLWTNVSWIGFRAYPFGYTQQVRVVRILTTLALVVGKRDAGGGYGRAFGVFYRCA